MQNDLFGEDKIKTEVVKSVDLTFLDAPYEEKIKTAYRVITKLLEEGTPLVYAWSGGKDSSVALDIGLKAAGGEVPPFAIIHGNTLLENPEIDRFTKEEGVKIEAFLAEYDLPGTVEIATPSMSQNHMVNLIGGRTIASLPGTDSKCSVDMKVNPINALKKRIFKKLGVEKEPVSIIGLR